jgi:transposase
MTILTVGIDLFAAHGVNDAGRAELVCPAMPRGKLQELIASLPPCSIRPAVSSSSNFRRVGKWR